MKTTEHNSIVGVILKEGLVGLVPLLLYNDCFYSSMFQKNKILVNFNLGILVVGWYSYCLTLCTCADGPIVQHYWHGVSPHILHLFINSFYLKNKGFSRALHIPNKVFIYYKVALTYFGKTPCQ